MRVQFGALASHHIFDSMTYGILSRAEPPCREWIHSDFPHYSGTQQFK